MGAMLKIGFIDYYLDEAHAHEYPRRIKEASGGTMEVAYAYGMKDREGGMTNAAWSEKHGIPLLASPEEVVRRSDALIVLSPDHPEMHETLADAALRSGKRTYVDKTFAPNRAAAVRLIELAKRHGTPMYSSSALRFAPEFAELAAAGGGAPQIVSAWGPGAFCNYAIHQIEPIVMLLGSQPQRVMSIGTEDSPSLLIDFGEGKQALMRHHGDDCPFFLAVQDASGAARVAKAEADFFASFISHLVRFFRTGEHGIDPAETLAVISLIEYGAKALQRPFEWFELP